MNTLRYEFTVPTSPKNAYEAWTTDGGIRSFFTQDFVLDPRPGGHYEMYFDPEAPKGSKGGEGCRILCMHTARLFGFTWNFPPTMPDLRGDGQHTACWVEFDTEKDGTKVVFTNTGFGHGGEWDYGLEYFKRAWGEIVLARYRYRFDHGPIDWSARPDYARYAVKATAPKPKRFWG